MSEGTEVPGDHFIGLANNEAEARQMLAFFATLDEFKGVDIYAKLSVPVGIEIRIVSTASVKDEAVRYRRGFLAGIKIGTAFLVAEESK